MKNEEKKSNRKRKIPKKNGWTTIMNYLQNLSNFDKD